MGRQRACAQLEPVAAQWHIARLAAYYLAAKPLGTLGVLSLLIFSGGVVVLTSDWVLVALASPLTLLLLRTADPVLRDATERFTA